mmetsp:Transcript_124690/g.302834  ORF Transcript_124690/g.302834 Transcript_124690/m.302834 type:complete len:598 (-) Transcript_124690:146-1939(-)
MQAGVMHPSASTQDLIRATRPKFPEGLKVLVVVRDEARHAPIKKLLQEIGYKVTCANTLDKGIAVLESAQGNSDVNAHFDVALVEEEQVAPIMRDAMHPGTASATTATSPLFGRFTTIAKEVAIVLMHEDEDVASKTYMIEAIKVGVVDVVKYPLVKQSMRTLWQHAVRKIIRQQATPADTLAATGGGASGAGKKRSSEDRGRSRDANVDDPNYRQSNSGDSSASEERALKRQSNSSPTTVLEDESNPGDGKGKADDNKAGGNAKKPTSTGGAKAKPQARSTQQWKAAEQRGRRLAIKPHTAMVQGQQGAQMGGRVAYWNPGSQMMQGTTQTMTVNGQQVQVWVPMQAGSYPAAGQQQQPGAGSAAGVSGAQSAPSAGAGGPQSSAAAGLSTAGAATAAGDGTQAAGSQPGQQQQQQFAYQGGVPVGPNGQPLPMMYPQGMVLVRQANGQMVYMQATPQMMQQHQMQQQGQYMQYAPGPYTHGASGDSTMVGSADDKAPAGSLAGPDLNLGDVGLKGQPLPLGLNLRRTNSLENMMGGGLGNQIDANVFNDAEPMEDDALDMLLRDGGGNLFDNMDDSMLAEAAANSTGEFFGMVNA